MKSNGQDIFFSNTTILTCPLYSAIPPNCVSNLNKVDFLDLEDILRALKLKKILSNEELRELIDDIEKKDWTIIKAKEAILKD